MTHNNPYRCILFVVTVVCLFSTGIGCTPAGKFLDDADVAMGAGDLKRAENYCREAAKRLSWNDPRPEKCHSRVEAHRLIEQARNKMSAARATRDYSQWYREYVTAYKDLGYARQHLPEVVEDVSRDWADGHWAAAERYWDEAEKLFDELTDVRRSEKRPAERTTRFEDTFAALETASVRAFISLLMAERIYPSYSLLGCKNSQSNCNEKLGRMRELRQHRYFPSRAIIDPTDDEVKDLARRAQGSHAAIFEVSSKANDRYAQIFGILQEKVSLGNRVVVCRGPNQSTTDQSTRVLLRLLPSKSQESIESFVDLGKYMGLFTKCQQLEPKLTTEKLGTTPMKSSTMSGYMADKMIIIYVDVDFQLKFPFVGSGFAINDRGYVVTNYHVVCPKSPKPCEGRNRPTDIQVVWRDRTGKTQRGWATLVETWKDEDLAVIAVNRNEWTLVPEARLAPLSLSGHKPGPLLEVLSYGYPSEANPDFTPVPERFITTVTSGRVSRVIVAPLQGNQRRISIVQHTATIGRGSSGGPVLDWCGRVVGVNTQERAFPLSEILSKGGIEHSLGDIKIPIEDGFNFASAAEELIYKLKAADIEHIVEPYHCPER